MKKVVDRISNQLSFSSLRMRLQMLVWVAIMPMLLLVVSENIRDRSYKQAEIREQAAGLVNLAKGSFDQHLTKTQILLETIAHSEAMQQGGPAAIKAFLRNMRKTYPEYANFGAVDLQGNVFASAVRMQKPVNASDMFWFQQTLRSRDFTVGEYQIGRITGIEVIVFGQPVFDKSGKMKFILFASMDITWMNRLWENIKLLPDSTFTVTDRSGIILFRYPLAVGQWIGKSMSHAPIVSAMLAKGDGISELDGLDKTNRIYAFTRTGAPGSGIHMAVGVSKKAALAPINNGLFVNLLALSLVAAFGLYLARLYSNKYIMTPIKALEEAADRFASGDYSSRINLTDGRNELIAYANVFDKMAETIEREIAVRKNTEQQLRESEGKLQKIIDGSSAVIFVKDLDGKYLLINTLYEKLFHVSKSSVIGKTDYDIFPREAADAFIKADIAVLKADQVIDVEETVPQDDGIHHYISSKFPLYGSDGAPYAVCGIATDLTEQKKSEELIHGILESVDEGFIIIDPDYRIISANRAYCEQMKSPECDIIGRHCYEVAHHIDKPCFMGEEDCAPRHTFKTGAPHTTIHTHYDKDNNPVYVESKSYPMKDSSGKIYAVIETLNNITEKRRLEDQLRHAQKMEAIGTLAGGIAHDFNNILSAIIGYGGLMQMKMKPDDPKMSQLKEILQAGDRAAQLTKGLLTFSRKQVMEVRTVNLNEIVKGFEKMLARIIGEDIELKVTLSEKVLTAKADIVQIEQVLMNLATNARDAMPRGGVLTIETRPEKIDREFKNTHGYGEPGKYALITVSDTGIGMDEKTREHIFEPFYTTKEAGRGTGLGLAIVYGIVTQHNGYLHCYSEPGKGTTFRIYIPLTGAEAELPEAEEAVVSQGGAETILVAEDDVSVRGLTKHLLEGFGYTVIEAVDGNDAVRRFKAGKDKIQLLLFDLIMPGKNGRDAYEEIRTIRPGIRVIFISGYARDIVQKFGIEEGVEFISKPVSPTELLRKVREKLDR